MGRRQATTNRRRTCSRDCDPNDCDHGGKLEVCGHWVRWNAINEHVQRCNGGYTGTWE